jgi:hypothetical protein
MIIGVMFDGWTGPDKVHYVGVFAVFPEKVLSLPIGKPTTMRRQVLLALVPLLDEASFTAAAHVDYLVSTLKWYGKSFGNVLFIVADNCSTNGAIVRFEEVNVPLIGCKAHIFNLALKLVFKGACGKKGKDNSDDDGPITKVHKIMKHLDTLKNRGLLREHEIHYAPVLDNETRWTSKYSMLKRYTLLRDKIDKIEGRWAIFGNDMIEDLLSASEEQQIKGIMDVMKKLFSIMKVLQSEDITLHDSRYLFDKVLADYGATFQTFIFTSTNLPILSVILISKMVL